MDLDEIKTTDTWELFEKGRNYLRSRNVYVDTDRNYRMYNGNQWEGAQIGGIEQAQYNFIETIVNYKVSAINQNLYGIHYSSENYEDRGFAKNAKKVCELLDKKASQVWEKDQLDYKLRNVCKDSAVNDEGLMYVWFDKEKQSPVNEILKKNDVQFGNEQSSDIQSQPYIVIAQRRPVSEVRLKAQELGASKEELQLIAGDLDYFDQSGEDAKYEKDEMCTLITKMFKKDGEVWYQSATKYFDIDKPQSIGLSYYPISHFVWREKEGWSRGEGEVRGLIPNQLELNKTLARYLLAIKQTAYAQKVLNMDYIINPDSANQVGGVLKVQGKGLDDVSKAYTIIQPAQMSTDVSKVINDLISITRDLKNTSNIATGGINPEQASGKAILAVQQASQQPLTEQSEGLKRFVEDIARIWLDMWTKYTPEGMVLQEDAIDENGEEFTQNVQVPASILENLNGAVRIDITPMSPYDKYARELSIENMFKNGLFNAQKLAELKIYANLLPDNSTMPKQDILEAIEMEEEEQRKIAEIQSQAQLMQSRAQQFLDAGVEGQAGMINDANQMIQEGQ